MLRLKIFFDFSGLDGLSQLTNHLCVGHGSSYKQSWVCSSVTRSLVLPSSRDWLMVGYCWCDVATMVCGDYPEAWWTGGRAFELTSLPEGKPSHDHNRQLQDYLSGRVTIA